MTLTKRVLVTGAGGFIGRCTIAYLLERGYEVHTVGREKINREGVWSHRADLLSPLQVESVLQAVRPTHLLHFAWIVTPGYFWTAVENTDWVAATLQLVRAFVTQGGTRATLAGSCAEYSWTHEQLDERTTPCTPHTPYGIAKKATFDTLSACIPSSLLSLSWGRIFLLYGPHEARNRLFPDVITSLLEGKEALCSHGLQERDVMYVEEVARAFVELLDSPVQGAVNIATGECRSLRSVVDEIGTQLNAKERIRYGAKQAPANDPARLAASVDRLRNEVGFVPRISLEEGVARSIAWWRAQAK